MMKEPDWKNCSEEELWQWASWHLSQAGIPTVLVGGAAAAVHSRGAYRSGDLDLLLDVFPLPRRERLREVMQTMGFTEAKGRYFANPKCKHLYIEFVNGPLHLGEDYEVRPQTRRVQDVNIKIISPTDSIRDRLTSYVYFKARECLDQALLVAHANRVQWKALREWALREGPEMQKAVTELRRLRGSNDDG